MKNRADAQFILWSIVCLGCIFNLIVRGVLLMTSSDALQALYIPDDTYYYLTLARNFSQLGIWTFDSGISVTTGFHPLYAYLLVIIELLFHPSLSNFVQLSLLLSLTTTVTVVLSAWLICVRCRRTGLLFVLALIIAAPDFIFLSTAAMEWSFVLVCAFLYLLCFYRCITMTTGWRTSFALFGVGFLGSLARTDFGLLPGGLFMAVVIVNMIRQRNLNLITPLFGLLGAVAGVVAVLLHNYAFTGSFLQSSARVKLFWSSFYPPDYTSSIRLFPRSFGVNTELLFFLISLLIGILVLLLLYLRARQNNQRPLYFSRSGTVLGLGAVFCIITASWFYARNGDIQAWYTANLIIPSFLVVSALTWAVRGLLGVRSRHILSFVSILIIIGNIANVYPVTDSKAPFPWQKAMYEAGVQIGISPPLGLVGAWNAGLIGYYGGGDVVNLDGLVNDDAYPYIVSNTLPTYIEQLGIRHIVDGEEMVTEAFFSQRGGYNVPEFLASLSEGQTFIADFGLNGQPQRKVAIYTVVR